MATFGALADDAAEDSVPTSVLLRRLEVLAVRANISELENWVDHEINGWPTSKDIPEYRGPFDAIVLAHISGPMGAGYENYPLPPEAFGAKAAEGALFKLVFRQSMTELESLIAGGEQMWQERWPADTVLLANQLIQAGGFPKINRTFVINQAYKVIPIPAIVGVVDAVRSRVMKLALDLEKLSPADPTPLNQQEHRQAVQIINTRIYGGTHNIAIASSHFDQYLNLVVPGDKDSLVAALTQLGIPQSEIDSLDQALLADGSTTPPAGSEPRQHVKDWCWRLMSDGGGRFASNVAGQVTAALAVQAVLHFFGA